ncbi:MAG: exodeoxyribonuclease VII large subunit [bacterium]|nr:exodeoxyribonuclease VII large subunit [bacterium]
MVGQNENAETAVKPLTVTEFIEQVNAVMADQVAWVEGEVCDLHISQGKWMYFSLKDEASIVNCFAMLFRVRTPIEEGMKVRVWGVPRIYPKFGKFSINVEIVEPSGEGALKRAFELLKRKMEAEGLFDPARKRRLPRFPEKIALITSSDAAAYTDFIKVLKARRGGIEINFISVAVQGREATKEICSAIEQLNESLPDLDALVLVRGGGSIEDLHAFNDEGVVRTLARSRIPTMTGVGHERDVTLVDYVSDVRGSTPSNCAELLTPTREDLIASINQLTKRMADNVQENINTKERGVQRAVNRLHESVANSVEKVQFLAQQMVNVGRIFSLSLQKNASGLQNMQKNMRTAYTESLNRYGQKVVAVERVLNSMHPEKTLARGYSITKTSAGKVIRDALELKNGDSIRTVLHRGIIDSIINSSEKCLQNPPKISPNPTKNSKKSSRSLKQATLI